MNNDFTIGYTVDDKQFIKGLHATVSILLFESRNADQIRLGNPDNRLLFCINEWFSADEQLKKDFVRYLKTVIYLKKHSDSVSGQRSDTLANFRTRNNNLKGKIKELIIAKISSTRYVSGQSLVDSSDIQGSTPQERHKNAVENHLRRIFKHMKLAESYAATNQELRDKLKSPQQKTIDNSLTQAEEMVENEILNLGNEANVADLVNKFSRPPFGWKDTAVIDILTRLNVKRKRSLEYKNNTVTPLEFADKAFSNAERTSCVVKSLSGPGQEEINAAIKNFRDTFNEHIKEDTDFEKVISTMKQKIESFRNDFSAFEDEYYGKYPPGIHLHKINEEFREVLDIRNPINFFKELEAQKEKLNEDFETAKTLTGWLNTSGDAYKKAINYIQQNISNIKSLENGWEEKASRLEEFLNDSKPWDNFRFIAKAIDEFKAELDKKIKAIKTDVISKYNAIYDELEKKIKEEKLEESKGFYRPRNEMIGLLQELNSYTDLENHYLKADNFSEQAWENIYEEINKKKASEGKPQKSAVKFKPGKGKKIELKNTEEVESFVEEEKKALLKLIEEGKIIIIN